MRVFQALSISFIFMYWNFAFGIEKFNNLEELSNYLNTLTDPSVESFIGGLNSKTRSQFALMYNTRSIQGASFQNPRVIMHSEYGQTFLTFNGDKKQVGGNNIELILFNEKENILSAHEIQFKKGGKYILNKNPQKCMSCHGVGGNLRPLWNHYNQWPGAYGSDDDSLGKELSKHSYTELRELQKFVNNYKNNPRYKSLVNIEDHLNIYNNQKSGRTKRQSNSILTEIITGLNYRRLTNQLRKKKYFETRKYQINTLFGCPNIDSFYSTLEDSLKENIQKYVDLKQSSFRKYYGKEEFEKNRAISYYLTYLGIDAVNAQTNIFDVLLDEDFRYFPMNVYKFSTFRESYTHYIFNYYFDQFKKNYVEIKNEKIKNHHQEFANRFGLYFLPSKKINCEEVVVQSNKRKSINKQIDESFSQIRQKINASKGKRIIINSCLKCHFDKKYAGFSFKENDLIQVIQKDPKIIKDFSQLISKDAGYKRMPFNGPYLNSKKSELLINYFTAVRFKFQRKES